MVHTRTMQIRSIEYVDAENEKLTLADIGQQSSGPMANGQHYVCQVTRTTPPYTTGETMTVTVARGEG